MDSVMVEQRIEKLELENRRLRRAAWAAIAAAGLAILLGVYVATLARPTFTYRHLDAQNFVLRDSRGRVRARLDMSSDAPGFRLYDAQGHVRAVLAMTPLGPGLALIDAATKSGVILAQLQSGPNLVFHDTGGNTGASIGLGKLGPSLSLNGTQGEGLATLSVTSTGPGLSLLHVHGRTGQALDLNVSDGGPHIAGSDGKGLVAWLPTTLAKK